MYRRPLLAGVAAAVAGCGSRSRSTATPRRSPARVTTTGAPGVEILVAQLVVRDDAAGPEAFYRFRNTGERDATVAVRTVLRLEGGGSYPATAVVDVPAGDEVTLRYRIVRYDSMTEADRTSLDAGEGVDYDVFLNGDERPDV